LISLGSMIDFFSFRLESHQKHTIETGLYINIVHNFYNKEANAGSSFLFIGTPSLLLRHQKVNSRRQVIKMGWNYTNSVMKHKKFDWNVYPHVSKPAQLAKTSQLWFTPFLFFSLSRSFHLLTPATLVLCLKPYRGLELLVSVEKAEKLIFVHFLIGLYFTINANSYRQIPVLSILKCQLWLSVRFSGLKLFWLFG
jgi:hypothetical protein